MSAPTGSTLGIVAADPYPWPWDGPIDPHRLALVVAGWDEQWRARVADPEPVLAAVRALAARVAAVGGRTLWLAHDRPPRAPLPVPDGGTGRPAPLPVPDGGIVVAAAGIDGFCGSDLDLVLRRAGLEHLLLAGLGLEAPVHSTMRSANDRGYECLLVVDACAPLTAATAAGAVSSVTMSGGIFGAVADLADVFAALSTDPLEEEP